jgi:hypothetical protein
VFGSYNFFSDSHRAHIQKPDVPVLAVSLNGISKLLGLPQLKLAWVLIQNTGKDSEALLSRLDIVADTFLSVNTPVQAALPTLLSYADSLSGQIHSRVHSQYQLLQTTFADSNATVLHSEGGWYAILQLTQSHNDEEWAIELLQKENILVYPGHFFEMEQPSCLVLSLLPPSDLFQTAAGTIRAFLSNR